MVNFSALCNSFLTIAAGTMLSHSASVSFSLIGCSSSGWGSEWCWSCEEGDGVSFRPSRLSLAQATLSWPIASSSSDAELKGGVARMEDIILWRRKVCFWVCVCLEDIFQFHVKHFSLKWHQCTERVNFIGNIGRGGQRGEERRREETRGDETRREQSRGDETRRDETRRDETRRDGERTAGVTHIRVRSENKLSFSESFPSSDSE